MQHLKNTMIKFSSSISVVGLFKGLLSSLVMASIHPIYAADTVSLICKKLPAEPNADQIEVVLENLKPLPIIKLKFESSECSSYAKVTVFASESRTLGTDCGDAPYELTSNADGKFDKLVKFAKLGPSGRWAIKYSCVENQ